ncbi:unnamed protein product [Discosporangium mesarthrocarpum]
MKFKVNQSTTSRLFGQGSDDVIGSPREGTPPVSKHSNFRLMSGMECRDRFSDDERCLAKRKLEDLVETPESRSSAQVDRFLASPMNNSHPRTIDLAARPGPLGTSTPLLKRRAILCGGDGDGDVDAAMDTEATTAAATALLAVRSSEGPNRKREGRDLPSPPAPANMSLSDFCRSSPATTLMSRSSY